MTDVAETVFNLIDSIRAKATDLGREVLLEVQLWVPSKPFKLEGLEGLKELKELFGGLGLNSLPESPPVYNPPTLFTLGIGTALFTSCLALALRWFWLRRCRALPPLRRAARLANGARNQSILLLGSPSSPLTQLVAHDLYQRGYLVHLTLFTPSDHAFATANPTDFYHHDFTNVTEGLAELQMQLGTPQVPAPGFEPHTLTLAAAVVLPDWDVPTAPIETLDRAAWARVTSRLQAIAEALPLLIGTSAKLILLSHVIIPALRLPFHALETVASTFLEELFLSLGKELPGRVTRIRLGNIQITNQGVSKVVDIKIQREVLGWTERMRETYGPAYRKVCRSAAPAKGVQGTPLRELYHVIVDVVQGNRQGVVYCGTGARVYSWVKRFRE